MSGFGDLFGDPLAEENDDAPAHELPGFDVRGLFEDADAEVGPADPGKGRAPADEVASFFEIDAGVTDEPSAEAAAFHDAPTTPLDDGGFDRLPTLSTDALATRGAAAAFDTVALDTPVHADQHVGELDSESILPVAGADSRGGLRRGRWAAVAAAVAVVALLAGGIVLGFVLNAKPSTVEAMQRLESSERSVAARVDRINADIDALTTALEASRGSAASFADPLARMAGVSDDAARTAAEQAREAYVTALDALVVPEEADEAERGDIDTEVLAEVEAEQASVDARSAELDRLAADVAAVRSALAEEDAAFHAAIAAFVATIPAYGAGVVEENPEAEESFRAAVTETAQTVSTTDPFAPNGFAAWDGYAAAVGALRADEQRAVEEREAEEEYYYYYYEPPATTPDPEPEPSDPEPDPDDETPPAEG